MGDCGEGPRDMNRRSFVVASGLLLVLVGACVGDEPSAANDSSNDGGSDGATGDGTTANSPPAHTAQSVSFVDVDPKVGTVGGTVLIQKAADESDVSAYAIYSGTDATHKSSPTPLATLSATGKNLTYRIAEGTAPQPGVTTLLVYTQNAAGESTTVVSTPFVDATMHQVPIGDPDAGNWGSSVGIAFDETNRKLLIVTSALDLFRCELDGTGCVETDISQGRVTTNSSGVGLTLDPAGKILAVGTGMFLDGGGGDLPALFGANLDGSSPFFADVSAGLPSSSCEAPAATIDSTRNKLMIVGQDLASGQQYQPMLFECNLDGSSCTTRDLSTGTSETFNSGGSPSIVVDPIGKNLLVATTDLTIHDNPGLWICPLAGTPCTTEDVSTALGSMTGMGETPTILLDTAANKIDIVSASAGSSRPYLFRCNTDGSNCLATDLTTGTGAGDNSAQVAGAVLDSLDGKIGVFTNDRHDGFNPSLFRCNTDGSACTYTDITLVTNFSVWTAKITVDPETGQLFGLALDSNDNFAPSLFFLR